MTMELHKLEKLVHGEKNYYIPTYVYTDTYVLLIPAIVLLLSLQ